MNDQILGLVGLGLLLSAIFIGFPIAFTLGAVAIIIGFIHIFNIT
jgi:TRAP-type mannitol/chloroaromatic compound transport system permease large subunit